MLRSLLDYLSENGKTIIVRYYTPKDGKKQHSQLISIVIFPIKRDFFKTGLKAPKRDMVVVADLG